MAKRVLLSWSSGKDSAWALHLLRQSPEIEVAGLLTTVNEKFGRVAMHGTRLDVVRAQAAAANLPLWEIPLPWPCSNADYEHAMSAACERAVRDGIRAIAFGDLFLEDVRQYREERLRGTGLEPMFPVWGVDTRQLLGEMLDGGLKARIVCVDPSKLDASFAGKELAEVAKDFPSAVDPCGENGEFHTVVHAGPMFRQPLPLESGEIVTRDGFVYADFTPGE
jgi:uncharacterized protein (TIGR00290 family)